MSARPSRLDPRLLRCPFGRWRVELESRANSLVRSNLDKELSNRAALTEILLRLPDAFRRERVLLGYQRLHRSAFEQPRELGPIVSAVLRLVDIDRCTKFPPWFDVGYGRHEHLETLKKGGKNLRGRNELDALLVEHLWVERLDLPRHRAQHDDRSLGPDRLQVRLESAPAFGNQRFHSLSQRNT